MDFHRAVQENVCFPTISESGKGNDKTAREPNRNKMTDYPWYNARLLNNIHDIFKREAFIM